MEPRLVRRAVSGLSIWLHDSGAYQVIRGRRRPSSSPLFTSHDLARAEDWRRAHSHGPGRPISTNSADNAPIRFRVSDAQLAELNAEARALPKYRGKRLSASQVAKLRAFPRSRP